MPKELGDNFLNDLNELDDEDDGNDGRVGGGGVVQHSYHELLNDFDSDGGEEDDEQNDDDNDGDNRNHNNDNNENDNDQEDEDEDDNGNENKKPQNKDVYLDVVLNKIMRSKYTQTGKSELKQTKYYQDHLQKILLILSDDQEKDAAGDGVGQEENKNSSDENNAWEGNMQDDPEYNLIITCNKIISEIDEEIIGIHRYVCDIYNKKFPELESLIPNKIDYVKTILRIGNEMDMTLVELNDLLPSASVMVVSVTGSTTNGQPLSEKDLTDCQQSCHEILQLDADKSLILQFVQSRMSRIAPNTCLILGSRLTAQLIGLAGGILALSLIPACNIQVMGQEKRLMAGFSNISSIPHQGIIQYCDLVQSTPPYLRKKVVKLVSSKVAISSRVDSYKHHPDGAEGRKLRAEIEEKIEKLQEPPKARTKKALPKPEDKKKSRRGGKRVKKWKERFAVTEMRALQNRIGMSVTEGEYGDSAMGVDLGMLSSKGKQMGKLRAPQRKEIKINKKQKNATTTAGLSSGKTNGLSSSLVFTPVQGLELINPNAAAERVKEANKKWFNSNSGFLSAVPKSK